MDRFEPIPPKEYTLKGKTHEKTLNIIDHEGNVN